MQIDDESNKWKNRVTDLEMEIRMLQHEVTTMSFSYLIILFLTLRYISDILK